VNRHGDWRSSFGGGAPAGQLRDWLSEPDSLTARCQSLSRVFRIRVLQQALERPLADESAARGKRRIRDVLLECDGIPVIFAHTTLLTATNGRLTRWLSRLGSRSLGSLLFSRPGFRRGAIEFCRLDHRHPLYRRAAALAPVSATLWARRSRHRLGQQEVLVTEVFLPAIERLGPVPVALAP